jgi:hypothetical protein
VYDNVTWFSWLAKVKIVASSSGFCIMLADKSARIWPPRNRARSRLLTGVIMLPCPAVCCVNLKQPRYCCGIRYCGSQMDWREALCLGSAKPEQDVSYTNRRVLPCGNEACFVSRSDKLRLRSTRDPFPYVAYLAKFKLGSKRPTYIPTQP